MAEQAKTVTEEKFYIDKTAVLEQALREYPCVYLEGAAASGKTTAIQMACRKQKNFSVLAVSAGWEKLETYAGRIARFRETNAGTGAERWIIVEDFPGTPTDAEKEFFVTLISQLGSGERLILEGREELPDAFFDFLWKGRLQLITQEALTLTRDEVLRLTTERNSFLNPSELYEETAGWAGCVDLLLRMTVRPPVRMGTGRSVRDLLQRSEVQEYLQREILQTLRPTEKEILRCMDLCPWMHPSLCQEVFQISDAERILEALQRKGILTRCCRKSLWKKVQLFDSFVTTAAENLESRSSVKTEFLRTAGEWFSRNGFPEQALFCLDKAGDRSGYLECLRTHYKEIPFSGIARSEAFRPEDSSLESCYLRGMEAVLRHDWAALDEEIRLTEKKKEQKKAAEIWMNLTFLNPMISMEDWLKKLKQTTKVHGPIRLYHILGGSASFLCGLRDLSELFVGGKKAERKRAEIWKNNLGLEEWNAYQLARIEFYLETSQKDKIPDEDWKLLLNPKKEEPWTILLARYVLLIKIRRFFNVDQEFPAEREEAEDTVRKMLAGEENVLCQRLVESADVLRSNAGGEKILFTWLREKKSEWSNEICEESVGMWYLRAMACYEIQQYDRTDKILKKLIPFARSGRRSRFLAECLFQQAAVNWYREDRKQSLQNVVESFLVTGEFRYVGFYTNYGRNGYEVLKAYMEWMSSAFQDTWSRKKKYNYGNVLNMPLEDYLNTILRKAKKSRGEMAKSISQETEEALTMTEIIILRELSTGMTNEEICTDLNLKLTTVKGHIYNIYKKLGVKSRVQALLVGRERGLFREV